MFIANLILSFITGTVLGAVFGFIGALLAVITLAKRDGWIDKLRGK